MNKQTPTLSENVKNDLAKSLAGQFGNIGDFNFVKATNARVPIFFGKQTQNGVYFSVSVVNRKRVVIIDGNLFEF